MTAVEWLNAELERLTTRAGINMSWAMMDDLLQQAKEKEREQIIKAVDSVQLVQRYYYKDGTFGDDLMGKEVSAGSEREYYALSTTGEQYYNKNYNHVQQP
jgi:N-methylhydantoinase B/oxoprolinase/acetone carboxylase alpha subunit